MTHRLAAATRSVAAATVLFASATAIGAATIQTPSTPTTQTPSTPTTSPTGTTATTGTRTTGTTGAPGQSGATGTTNTPTTAGTTAQPTTQPLTTIGQPDAALAPPAPVARARETRAPAVPSDPRSAEMAVAYQIGPEDLLDISVWKNLELSRVVPVRPDGKVSLPLVNDIAAAGLTPDELRDQITSRLAEFIPAPEVSVMVKEVHSRKVAVVGAVKMPGRYELRSPMTVLEAVALAQGLTDFASKDKIQVIRIVNGKTTYIPFNYRKAADGAQQENFFVRAGDIVIVP
jgi:polysaccharide biosynthesis/export protein